MNVVLKEPHPIALGTVTIMPVARYTTYLTPTNLAIGLVVSLSVLLYLGVLNFPDQFCPQWHVSIISFKGSVQAQKIGETQRKPVQSKDVYCEGDKLELYEDSEVQLSLSNYLIIKTPIFLEGPQLGITTLYLSPGVIQELIRNRGQRIARNVTNGSEEKEGDKMDSTVIAAIIGLIATIAAAYITKERVGKKEYASGLQEGRRHSIIEFMDEQEKLLDRAMDAISSGDHEQLTSISTAIVDTAVTWRKIQENLRDLLNGRIDDLNGLLREGKAEALEMPIRVLREGFEIRRLALETALAKSKI